MEFIDIFKNIESIEKSKYLKYTILYHGAPTFFSSKPATIITFNNFGANTYDLWKELKEGLFINDIYRFIELYDNKQRCTVMFYNEKNLMNAIYCENNMSFLQSYGYDKNMKLDEILNHLKFRYEFSCPHEIGIFLGFPIEDVIEFINGEKKNCLLLGYWKVYYNLEKAKNTFYLYDNAKDLVLSNILKKEIE
ncbi:MAG: DUF3793 family protein [Clostridiaceae bacterium]